MVSGLVTSPCDQLRIFSGEASMMRMASKSLIGLVSSNGLERNKATLLCVIVAVSRAYTTGPLPHPGERLVGRSGQFPQCLFGCPIPAAFSAARMGVQPLIGYGHVDQFRLRKLLQIRALDQLDIQAKRLQLADQHVEALRYTWLDRRFDLDDGLVDL